MTRSTCAARLTAAGQRRNQVLRPGQQGGVRRAAEVWGDLPENKRPQMAADTLLDVVEMALKACDRLPHF
jgi:hypothetical protein